MVSEFPGSEESPSLQIGQSSSSDFGNRSRTYPDQPPIVLRILSCSIDDSGTGTVMSFSWIYLTVAGLTSGIALSPVGEVAAREKHISAKGACGECGDPLSANPRSSHSSGTLNCSSAGGARSPPLSVNELPLRLMNAGLLTLSA